MKQETMGWQWHQLNHMQIICTSLQTDNHASTSALIFLEAYAAVADPGGFVGFGRTPQPDAARNQRYEMIVSK